MLSEHHGDQIAISVSMELLCPVDGSVVMKVDWRRCSGSSRVLHVNTWVFVSFESERRRTGPEGSDLTSDSFFS